MSAVRAMAAALLAGQSATPNPDAAAAPPSIESLLEQPPMDEDARQAAVRAAYAAAQARRGELDGRWRLTALDGRALYLFQFSDPGDRPDPRSISPSVPVIEGAWSAAGANGGSGFLTNVHRDGASLIVRFTEGDRTASSRLVNLRQGVGGDWSGTLEGEAAPLPVVMTRF